MPPLGDRLQYRLLRTLSGLSPALQVRLSRRPPVQLDGDTLSPDVQLSLALLALRKEPPPETLTPEQARATRRRLAAVFAGRPVEVASTADLTLDTDPPLRARQYVPPEQSESPPPMLVFFHGGGFVYGDLETHDAVCRIICRHSGAHVLAIDYRLAPEHPFPAAVEDAQAAFGWACANAARLGADPARVGVIGDSAGGNLAAVVSQLAARDGGPAPAVQVLIYPVTDFSTRRRSRELFAEGFLLTDEEMDWFETQYLGSVGSEHTTDPRVSPILSSDLSGLAPALVVTAAFDPLRDEAEEYAAALSQAGTPATLRRFPGFIHAFIAAAGVSQPARDGLVEIAGAARGMLALVPRA